MANKKSKGRKQKSIRKQPLQKQKESNRIQKPETEGPPSRPLTISFKYFTKPSCLSKLDKPVLRDFTKFIKRISKLERHQIQTDKGLGCKLHKGKPASGYTYPPLSEKPTYFEMRLNDKGRVHGFFSHNIFFLIWIDPNHEVFPIRR